MDKLKKIIEYGLYFLAFLLPLQTRWIIKSGELNGGYSEYGTVSLYATDIGILALLFLLLFFIYKKHKLRITLIKSPSNTADRQLGGLKNIWFLIAALELIIIVSIFVSIDKTVALFNYGRFLLGIGLFWLMININYERVKLIYYFLAGVTFQAVIGIWQFLNQTSFSSKWLGIAKHLPADLGVSVIETVGLDGVGERWLRAYGGMDHPNILGGLLVIGILFLISQLLKNKFNNSLFTTNKIFVLSPEVINYFLVLIMLTALFFTFSRAAWLGLAAGVMFMIISLVVKKDFNKQISLAKIILMSGILIFILAGQYKNLAITRITGNSRLETMSNIERIDSCKQAYGVISENWFLGTGIGNYTLLLADNNEKLPGFYYQPVHNTYLLILAEIGIFGMVVFLILIFYLFKVYFKKSSSLIKTTLLVILFLMFLFDHWWWSLHIGVMLFWFIIGLLMKNYNDEIV